MFENVQRLELNLFPTALVHETRLLPQQAGVRAAVLCVLEAGPRRRLWHAGGDAVERLVL